MKSKKMTAGFTLVELIVVIAILGILAGVGTVGYSGYIKKANMAADQQLVSQVRNALVLAYYGGDLVEDSSGFLMLSTDEDGSFADENGATALAMEKAFGSNWLDTMQLKYDSWDVGWNAISYEDAATVANSNFVQKYSADELMEQVQAITNAVNGLQGEAFGTTYNLYQMFNYADGSEGNVIEDVMADYGITTAWDDLSSTEKSNLLVLATASSITNESRSSAAADVISAYALYTAYAAENAEFNEAYKTFQSAIANVDPNSATSEYEQIKAAYSTLKTAADGSGFNTWQSTYGDNNKAAFAAIMGSIGTAMEDNGDAILNDLGNENMFTSGVGYDMYNDYLSSVYAIAAGDGELMEAFLGGDLGTGVLVQYAVENGNLYIADTLPVT